MGEVRLTFRGHSSATNFVNPFLSAIRSNSRSGSYNLFTGSESLGSGRRWFM